MKRFISWLLVVVLLLTLGMPVAMAADERTSGAFTYRIKGNGTAAIIGYDWDTMKGKEIFIPRMLDGYLVTEIGEEALGSVEYDSNGFPIEDGLVAHHAQSVVIPDTIKKIGEKAFWNISFSSSNVISIPNSVEYIGAGAFSNIVGITQFVVSPDNPIYATIDKVLYNKKEKKLVAIPVGLEPSIVQIESNAYVSYFEIPEGIISIEDFAFWDIKLKGFSNSGIIFPSSLKEIGKGAFGYALEDDSRIDFKLPSSLTTLKEGAFYKCRVGFNKLDMSTTQLTQIPAYTFYGCFFRDDLYWPKMLTTIGKGAFAWSIIGKKIIIPPSVQEIEDDAFYYALGTGYISIPEDSKLKEIGKSAFSNSSIQRNVVLPTTLERIDDYAFMACPNLETITLPSSVLSIGKEICRTTVFLGVEKGSYASSYASDNGYVILADEEDTSWLND